MIPLRLKAETSAENPFVVRLNVGHPAESTQFDARLLSHSEMRSVFSTPYGELALHGLPASDQNHDVLLVIPSQGVAHRLIRASSRHNTLLVTERCDQLCLMCSQPPKKHHTNHFPVFHDVIRLAPQNSTIGISGGEPLLFKEQLLSFLTDALSDRPDLSFHVLTNAQHFESTDLPSLRVLAGKAVVWGVPIYSDGADRHDEIVGKKGAFERLKQSLSILARSGSPIELRTVAMRSNVNQLERLATFITSHLPFIHCWAIMQLESIGYGRMNWDCLFHDSSIEFQQIAAAIDIVRARAIDVSLYNFPLCSIPDNYRALATASISDWKRRYLPRCEGCPVASECGGFFQWYPEDRGFKQLGLQ